VVNVVENVFSALSDMFDSAGFERVGYNRLNFAGLTLL
jgi:hypothetical protein